VTPALRGVVLVALLVPAVAQAAPEGEPVARRERSYVGLGVGTGWGDGSTFDGERSPSHVYPWAAFELRAGVPLRPALLLGLDFQAVIATTRPDGVHLTLPVAFTWFPWSDGFFLRGAAGLSIVPLSGRGDTISIELATGVSAQGGVGWAFWIGERLSLTLRGDVRGYWYGSTQGGVNPPRDMVAGLASVGLDWF
jgi:hypothetical protein